jgi:hypothetical protein
VQESIQLPPSLAETDGSLRSGSKASLLEILTSGVNCPPGIEAHELGDKATLVVDGQAHVCALGKPQGAATFGDLADTFVKSLLAQGHAFKRIDIVFDRYDQLSIKGGTRKKRSKAAQPINDKCCLVSKLMCFNAWRTVYTTCEDFKQACF